MARCSGDEQLFAHLEAGPKRPFDEFGRDELGRTCSIGEVLELTGSLVEAPAHDLGVVFEKQPDELVGVLGGAATTDSITDDRVSADDVVGVLRPSGWHLSVEHDPRCFIECELGSLDEVREVGLVERQQLASCGVGRQVEQARRRSVGEIRNEPFEADDAAMIDRAASSASGESGGCRHARIAG